jgi:hypothetical protein
MTTESNASATERAQHAASTAGEQGQHVAGVAADEARSVAGEAAQQVRGIADQARGQVRDQLDEQSRTQRDRVVGTLGTLGDDLHRMADGADSGLATDLAREVADRVQGVARHLDGREPSDLLDDVRRFARQRPGTFLLGALAAGVVVGRVARGARDGAVAAGAEPTAGARTPGAAYVDTTPTRPVPSGGAPTSPPVTPAPPTMGTAAGEPVEPVEPVHPVQPL